ncbi:type II toxin-antitoxin system HipA family toxin [Mucilaginibacter auburnensis]|uniref:Serine/threonine-protein kinase HipA n=1 Tax=Mucilaginibacter auburnensis TaxID=1457233 RepID=A0A2H9VQ15_9SPHI|nr:type II toxin-antitoxin system HipA family toxin [Mucilaginibacter auburnensis]PJJ80424.1 serine/threonine-protein kinase HipA [Mucilaginibacter auburnensis]
MNTSVKEVKVGLDFGQIVHNVGRLAIRDRIIYFEYNDSFLQQNINISPLRLPLQRGLIELPQRPFEGLSGVFNDSLPDGWGRLLFDRLLRSKGILPGDVSPLSRLVHVGSSGMGALVYEPDNSPANHNELIDLNHLYSQTQEVLTGSSADVIKELLALNGASAGARPKALIDISHDRKQITHGLNNIADEFEPWIVKFSNSQDGADAGAIEYVYALMAKEAGVPMPDVHLFPSINGAGYFAVKRFDRDGAKRLHVHTASGLLHSDFRTPSLDYETLLTLTSVLTKDIREVEKMYRLAVFNVLSHNRDDHAKNFSFLMDERGQWHLSPAYDLTFSSGPGGEQSTMVMGEGRNPQTTHLVKLGQEVKLSKKLIDEIIEKTKNSLNKWPEIAVNHHVSRANIQLIAKKINN